MTLWLLKSYSISYKKKKYSLAQDDVTTVSTLKCAVLCADVCVCTKEKA